MEVDSNMDSEDEMKDKRLQWLEEDEEKREQVYLSLDRHLKWLLERVAYPEYDGWSYKADYRELTNELEVQLVEEPRKQLEKLANELLAKEKELEALKHDLKVLKHNAILAALKERNAALKERNEFKMLEARMFGVPHHGAGVQPRYIPGIGTQTGLW